VPTLVQSATQVRVDASSATTFAVTLTGTGSGNALVGLYGIYDLNTTWDTSGVDDGGNAWTVRKATATRTNRVESVVAWAVNITGGSRTITLSITGESAGANRYLTYGAQEWSGVATSSAEDTWDENSEVDIAVSDITAGPITTTDSGALFVGAAVVTPVDATLNWASPTSWTNSYRENDNNAHQGVDAGYWLPGSTQASYSPQWTHDNATGDGGAVVVALKADAGGSPSPVIVGRQLRGLIYS
jgi:hypothetical protein